MSELVEKVAREIRVATLKTVVSEITDAEIDEIFRTRLVDYDPEARAAIAAVAEWLDDALKDDDGRIYVPQFLRRAAGDGR